MINNSFFSSLTPSPAGEGRGEENKTKALSLLFYKEIKQIQV